MVTTTFASPLGEILLAADGRGLTGLWFEGQEHFGSTLLKEDTEHVEGADAVSGTGGMSSVSPAHGAASSVLERSWAWLNAYFAGQEPRFTPPLHMMGTAFQREVWFELLSVPRGEVATYGEIAQRVAARHRVPGNEAPVVSPRAVGAAVARNPISIIVPCHRVVAADGSLNGYAGGLDRKEWLLRLEGAYEEQRQGTLHDEGAAKGRVAVFSRPACVQALGICALSLVKPNPAYLKTRRLSS